MLNNIRRQLFEKLPVFLVEKLHTKMYGYGQIIPAARSNRTVTNLTRRLVERVVRRQI